MRLIVSPNAMISSFLGKQELSSDLEYVIPNFCHTLECDDGILVFNSINKALILLDYYDEKINFRENLSDTKKFLIENYFYVSKNFDQFGICNQMKTLIQNLKPNSKISNFDIFPTTDCNARCYYCFEHGSKRYSTDIVIESFDSCYSIRSFGFRERNYNE